MVHCTYNSSCLSPPFVLVSELHDEHPRFKTRDFLLPSPHRPLPSSLFPPPPPPPPPLKLFPVLLGRPPPSKIECVHVWLWFVQTEKIRSEWEKIFQRIYCLRWFIRRSSRRLKSTSKVLFKKRCLGVNFGGSHYKKMVFGFYQTPKHHPVWQTPDALVRQTGAKSSHAEDSGKKKKTEITISTNLTELTDFNSTILTELMEFVIENRFSTPRIQTGKGVKKAR